MKCQFPERVTPLKKIPQRKENEFTSRMSQIGFVVALCLTQSALAAAQNPFGAPPSPDAQKCVALAELNLEAASGGPAVITSARIADVRGTGLEELARFPGRF